MYADDEFKSKVLEIAQEAMNENGWCRDGVNEALELLGLKLPAQRKRALIRFEVEVFFDTNGEDAETEDIDRNVNQPDFDGIFNYCGYSDIEVTDITQYVEELEDADDD